MACVCVCVKGSIYSQDFRQVPTSPVGFSVTDANLAVTTNSAITVVWNNTRARVARYSTRTYFRITATSGTVVIGCYHGSGAPGYSNDRIEWRMTGMNGATSHRQSVLGVRQSRLLQYVGRT